MRSGFLTFPDLEAHDRFVHELEIAHPTIAERVTSSRLHPRLIVESISDEQLKTLLSAAQGKAQWHGDVQFHPFRG